MDMNDIRGLGDVTALVAFLGVAWWAYGSSRKQRFEEDANLPFADEQEVDCQVVECKVVECKVVECQIADGQVNLAERKKS